MPFGTLIFKSPFLLLFLDLQLKCNKDGYFTVHNFPQVSFYYCYYQMLNFAFSPLSLPEVIIVECINRWEFCQRDVMLQVT